MIYGQNYDSSVVHPVMHAKALSRAHTSVKANSYLPLLLICFHQHLLGVWCRHSMVGNKHLSLYHHHHHFILQKNKNVIFNSTVEIQLVGRQKNIKFIKLVPMLYTVLQNYKHT